MTDNTTANALADQIMNALRVVIDPELGYNIVDLGLVYDVAVEDNNAARIIMTTTTRGCPATNYLREGAHAAAAAVSTIGRVDIDLTYEPPWSPQMMSDAAKSYLGISDGGGW